MNAWRMFWVFSVLGLLVICFYGRPIKAEEKDNIKESEIEIEDNLEMSQESEEALQTEPGVRIRLTTSDYSSEYHENIIISSEKDFQLQANGKAQIFTGGQTIAIGRDYPFLKEGVVRVISEEGEIQIDSIAHRNQVNTYPGVLDLYLTDEGIIIVNETSLESYVERVVPSEMPAAYGLEAAKLQAVCARTYAYQRLVTGQIDEYGAIANDSTDYQVYNASLPKETSSQAVKETRGILLTYQGQPLVPYYFSTSCGFNTDNTVWGGERLPYLRTQNLSYRAELQLQQEEVFRQFITNWDYPAYEDDCAWYRWNYTVTIEELKEQLKERYRILFEKSPEDFWAEDIQGNEKTPDETMIDRLKTIEVTKRLSGGMAGEVSIVCDTGILHVKREMTIRKLFGNPLRIYSNQSAEGFGESEGDYLPSAFFCPIENREEEIIVSYTFCGGGNGHGIGLSQNAAYALLQSGLTWKEVLQFFYLGTRFMKVYK